MLTCDDDVRQSRGGSLLALLLLVPAPSIGTTLAMQVPATEGMWIGQGVYFFAKAWLIGLPAVWWLWVQRGRISLSPPKRGGFVPAAALGVLISLVIAAAYFILGSRWIDPEMVRSQADKSGIGQPGLYLAFSLYLCTINAVLEEFVWRWFVFRHCETLVPPGRGWWAVLLSAALFTVHHVIALEAQFDWNVTIVASLGVFVGGAVWSWCYLKYRSIWPGFVSHAIVDVTILLIGGHLIFG